MASHVQNWKCTAWMRLHPFGHVVNAIFNNDPTIVLAVVLTHLVHRKITISLRVFLYIGRLRSHFENLCVQINLRLKSTFVWNGGEEKAFANLIGQPHFHSQSWCSTHCLTCRGHVQKLLLGNPWPKYMKQSTVSFVNDRRLSRACLNFSVLSMIQSQLVAFCTQNIVFDLPVSSRLPAPPGEGTMDLWADVLLSTQ